MNGNHAQDRILKRLHSAEGQLAAHITSFSGSMIFVYFHVIWFGFWIVANQGLLEPYIQPFDRFPYGLLTMIVSLEAIFLATFIMIAQNREAMFERYREITEIKEEREVEDIQKNLNDIQRAINFIQHKISEVEQLRDVENVNTSPKKRPNIRKRHPFI